MIALYGVLVLSQVLDTLASELSANTQWVVVVFRTAPLLLLIGIIRKPSPRLLIWLCFLLLGYFVGATLGAFSPNRTLWDFVALAAASMLFIVAMFRSRYLSKQSHNNDVSKDSE
jgi:uncharacterized membrane protein